MSLRSCFGAKCLRSGGISDARLVAACWTIPILNVLWQDNFIFLDLIQNSVLALSLELLSWKLIQKLTRFDLTSNLIICSDIKAFFKVQRPGKYEKCTPVRSAAYSQVVRTPYSCIMGLFSKPRQRMVFYGSVSLRSWLI